MVPLSELRLSQINIDDLTCESTVSAEDSVYVPNGGLVLLWPFLPHYFQSLGLTKAEGFVDEVARSRAIYLLQYLVCGDHEGLNHRFALNKVLCGMAMSGPLESVVAPSDDDKRLGLDLLDAATRRWAALENMSAEGFRESFLMRKGLLQSSRESLTLTVFRGPADNLLASLPWSLDRPRFPWPSQELSVNWQ